MRNRISQSGTLMTSGNTKSFFLKMGQPRHLFCLFSFFSNTILNKKNCRLQRDSNTDRQSRPLDHHHGPKVTYDRVRTFTETFQIVWLLVRPSCSPPLPKSSIVWRQQPRSEQERMARSMFQKVTWNKAAMGNEILWVISAEKTIF